MDLSGHQSLTQMADQLRKELTTIAKERGFIQDHQRIAVILEVQETEQGKKSSGVYYRIPKGKRVNCGSPDISEDDWKSILAKRFPESTRNILKLLHERKNEPTPVGMLIGAGGRMWGHKIDKTMKDWNLPYRIASIPYDEYPEQDKETRTTMYRLYDIRIFVRNRG